jgi:hypothetical protein
VPGAKTRHEAPGAETLQLEAKTERDRRNRAAKMKACGASSSDGSEIQIGREEQPAYRLASGKTNLRRAWRSWRGKTGLQPELASGKQRKHGAVLAAWTGKSTRENNTAGTKLTGASTEENRRRQPKSDQGTEKNRQSTQHLAGIGAGADRKTQPETGRRIQHGRKTSSGKMTGGLD